MRIKNPPSSQHLKPVPKYLRQATSLSTTMDTSTHILPVQPSVVTAVVCARRAIVRAMSLLVLQGCPNIVPLIGDCPTAQYRLSADVVLLVA